MGIECFLVRLRLENERNCDEVKSLLLEQERIVQITENSFEMRDQSYVIEIMLEFEDVSIRFALCNSPDVDIAFLDLISFLRKSLSLSFNYEACELLAEINQERKYWQADFGTEIFPYTPSEAIQKIILK